MQEIPLPKEIPNWIDGEERPALHGGLFEKLNPADSSLLYRVARSNAADVRAAVQAACEAQPNWADTPPVRRGQILHAVAMELEKRREEVARTVALETGKSYRDALGETEAAIAQGLFMAGEGQRLYGRTTTSGTQNKYAMTIRQPIGVAGLIIAANTPIANVAWKAFPALVCGNAAVLKAAEDTPATAWLFARLAHDAGLPPGVLNIVQGLGPEVELGGKNPFVVCDDADLDNAVRWAALSAYSNAGQRCAAASRLIVFDTVYERFRDALVERTRSLRLGPGNDDDLGPVINQRQLDAMLVAVERAGANGAKILVGGHRLTDPDHRDGFYMAPTLIENVDPDDEISTTELFGPIACLYRASDLGDALALANRSPYGLTAAIHTRNLHRAIEFTRKVEAGVAVVNAGTYGSEPHMPFGGFKQSGNGTREPGTEALDVYSELKDVYITVDPGQL
jgi:aldehyde dehydrogenase (NAD+)